MGIAFVPVYIRYLGIEAYGLIGVYVTMQAWIALLDMGMTPTINREMAKYRAGDYDNVSVRRLLRTLESIYIVIVGIIICGTLVFAAPLAGSWLKVEKLSISSVETAIVIMGFIIATRWFMTLYRGAIMGLQEQVWLNKCIVFFATVRGLGVIPFIILVSPTIEAFFAFQAVTAVAELIVVRYKTYLLIPKSNERIYFDIQILKRVWNFAFGVFSVNILATVLVQADKVFISLLLPLQYLGFYTLATSVCGALTSLSAPTINGAYPKMTELIAKNEIELLAQTYHKLAQLLAIILVSSGAIISIYAAELLMLWTQDETTAIASASVLTVYAIGTVLNGLMGLPYVLQLSYGHTRLTIMLNSALVVILIPLMYWGVTSFGMIGAAYVWVLLNTIYILVGVPLMHRKFLSQEKMRWYLHAFILPVVSVVVPCLAIRWYVGQPDYAEQIQNFLVIFIAAIIAGFIAMLSTPLGRNKLSEIRF